ncbi:ATP-binding protein [Streptomyces sp. NPDC047981]|uniref:ATP-binding protein n=1 Tax=Streptomyces sp. NPDC047981 TaxID=3154610 RepID=UPI0034201BCF
MAIDLDGARAALRAGDPAALLGLRESQWLDAKAQLYDLRSPQGAESLAKHVAAFANTEHGGLIVFGIRTLEQHGREVLEELVPLGPVTLDVKQLRDLMKERITPAPRDVAIERIDRDGELLCVYIDIPPQPAGNLPYLVEAPVGKPGRLSNTKVAVPIREADGTTWLPRSEIHRLLSAGLAAQKRPGAAALAELVEEAVGRADARRSERPRYRVGQGLPSREEEFRQAYAALTHDAPVGEPSSEVHWDDGGVGVLQRFAPRPPAHTGWVLCALPHQRPVAVAEPVWQALVEAGSGAPGSPLAAIGYPYTPPRSMAHEVIGEDAERVDLDGGRWGRGQLVRTADGSGWRWEPRQPPSFEVTRGSRNWTSGSEPSLRVRATVTLPWADLSGAVISPARRRELADMLPFSPLAGVASILTERRGLSWRASSWEPGPHRNASDAVSYSSSFAGAAGRHVLAANVMAVLPTQLDPAAVACAELCVDLPSWREAVSSGGGTGREERLSWEEVEAAFQAAWETASDHAARVLVDDPAAMRWADVPAVELGISAGQGHDGAPQMPLDDVVDLAPLGATDRRPLTRMSVTLRTGVLLSPAARKRLLREALDRMLHGFGFVDAPEAAHR